jgi:alkanesulfonate monooxygenase SsuD/methylene tetrahydromethanopterin reductase-like flavin-dependent oxidoreductase (luciferase family)
MSNLVECAKHAENGGITTIWVNDLLSTPEAKGWSAADGGRFMDPLMTLCFLAGRTSRIHLGTGVLIAPYRPAIHQYKEIATLQELSGG